jgi:hypothetical protein
MLVFNRPLHTSLALAYALCNKHHKTDLHVHYSIHRNAQPPSKSLDALLRDLAARGDITLHYLLSKENQSCGGNVNSLMMTMSAAFEYDYFVKIDDDVLIGRHEDATMCSLLNKLEESEGVLLLMGQAVREHMRGSRPFCWETTVDGYRVVQRSNRANPMETMTAVSPRLLGFLEDSGKPSGCENEKGTFIPYTRKLTAAGARTGLVLTPAIQLQHIGLTSEIDRGSTRSWAPARDYATNSVIDMPCFDFATWEASHKDNAVNAYTLSVLRDLQGAYPAQKAMLERLENHVASYDPKSDDEVPLPKDPKRYKSVSVVSRKEFEKERTNGTTVRTPRTVKRVRVVKPPKPSKMKQRRRTSPIGATDV